MIWFYTAVTWVRRSITWKGWLAIGLLAAFLLFGGYCAQRAVQGERDRQAVRQAGTERKASSARETASGERLNDTITIRDREKELSDAVEPFPDVRPSPGRVSLNCQRLRQQGTPERALPVACRSGD